MQKNWKSGDLRDALDKTIKIIEEDDNTSCLISLHDLVDERLEQDIRQAGKGDTATIKKLTAKHPDDQFYQAAGLRKLVSLKSKGAQKDLLSAVFSDGEILSDAAAKLAVDLPEPKQGFWKQSLQSSKTNEVLGSLKVLAHQKDPKSESLILPLLTHEDVNVQEAAKKALEVIKSGD